MRQFKITIEWIYVFKWKKKWMWNKHKQLIYKYVTIVIENNM